MNRFTDLIRDLDMFSYPISLRFNKRGQSYSTLLGAFCSVIVAAALFFFVYIKVLLIRDGGADVFIKNTRPLDHKSLGDVTYGDTNLIVFNYLQNAKTGAPIDFAEM